MCKTRQSDVLYVYILTLATFSNWCSTCKTPRLKKRQILSEYTQINKYRHINIYILKLIYLHTFKHVHILTHMLYLYIVNVPCKVDSFPR